MDNITERRNRSRVNNELSLLTTYTYFDGLPIVKINEILKIYLFNELEPGIYCGEDGRVIEQVGPKTWLTFTWHKMEESGRYEVIAYVS